MVFGHVFVMESVMFRTTIAVTMIIFPAMGQAQTDSQIMAQCAAIYATSQNGLRDGIARDVMAHGEQVWRTAALSQAQAEGASDPETLIQVAYSAQTAEFEVDGQTHIAPDQYAYWMDFCRLFAFEQGISLLP